jgi:hypothetical protein
MLSANNFCTESRIKTIGKEKKHSGKISSPRAIILALSEEFLRQEHFFGSRRRKFKKSLSCLQTFSTVNIHLYKTYAQIWHNFNFVFYI